MFQITANPCCFYYTNSVDFFLQTELHRYHVIRWSERVSINRSNVIIIFDFQVTLNYRAFYYLISFIAELKFYYGHIFFGFYFYLS